MSRYCRTLALSLALLCVFTLTFTAVDARALTPPAPENLMVMPMGPDQMQLNWTPGAGSTGGEVFLVYRNGQLLTPIGIDQIDFVDTGLAPETPHTYTVQAQNPLTLETSPMSARGAEMTMGGMYIRVPSEAPTIQDAVYMAQPGTTILVSPGIYEEPYLDLLGTSGITIKGQDPEGVVLEMIGAGVVDLDQTPGTNITLSGVTISGGQVYMGPGDTVHNCVFLGSPADAVFGGGFVTNSVSDDAGFYVPFGETMLVANSIFMMDGVWAEQPEDVTLLHNNFVFFPPDPAMPGEGNYSDDPCFDDPGPPPDPEDPYWYPSFLPCPGPDTNAGTFVGLWVPDMMPDVGAFELYEPYTPAPPADLTAVFDEAHGELTLSWTLSPHDPWAEIPEASPYPVSEYVIYRSDTPDMWNPEEMMVQAGETTFSDYGIYPGQIYYYQVRASLGSVIPPTTSPFPIVSLPTNTVVTDPPSGLSGSATDSTVALGWAPPQYSPGPWEYNVYRNGKLITPFPIPDTFFTDAGLAPETPHIYTVQAVTPDCPYPPGCGLPPGGITTTMSEPFGIATAPGIVLRVPQDYPSIQAAVMAAVPGTSIHVGPGIYPEDIWTMGNSQIAIIGQDPQGVFLDLSGTPSLEVYLDGTNNTLAGFTIVGGGVRMGEGDTVSNCVFRDSPIYAIVGGGLVTNSVFDGFYSSPWPIPPVQVDPGEFMMVANSVFLDNGMDPFNVPPPPPPPMVEEGIFLLNNAFRMFDWNLYPGEGNFWDDPPFRAPGPPAIYVIEGGPCIDGGIGIQWEYGVADDVGAFELGLPYTPEPPPALVGTWMASFGYVELRWTASPDDPVVNPGTPNPIVDYSIYRSETPDFLPPNDVPIGMALAGETAYQDTTALQGITYYYQMRANGGYVHPWGEVLSLPSPTTSVIANLRPSAVDDSYSVNSNDTLYVTPHEGVLLNDTDPEGDPLAATLVGDVTNGTLFLYPAGDFDYTPNPGFFGTDTFTYVANDGVIDSFVATVTITVNGNTAPIADDQSVTTGKDLPAAITLTASDDDGDPLTYSVVSPPANGSLSGTPPSLTYTPAPGYWGVDTFTFVANDGMENSNVATVTITVTGPPWTNNTLMNGEWYINIEAGTPIHMTSDFTDVGGGDHVIEKAEYFLDTIGADGTGTAMSAADGSFDSPNEGVESFIDTSGWSGGGHVLNVHAYDGTDGWGPLFGRSLYITTTLHVDSFAMTTSTAKGMTSASATVQILDHLASPVADATVSGHWEGLTADVEIPAATAADGTVTFDSDAIRHPSGTFTFVVDDVSKEFDGTEDYVYNAPVPPPSGSIDYPPPPEPTEVCDDLVDNDGDGLVDCDDSDCDGTLECGGSCADITSKDTCTADPNCDWVGKGKDGSCQDAVSCTVTEDPEITCDDGIDNDCDGLTDTAEDPDCQAPQACSAYGDNDTCQANVDCEWVGNPNNGYCQEVQSQVSHYTLTGLGDLPGGSFSSIANDVNNNGVVVGQSFSAGGYEAFIWDPANGMIALGDLPGGTYTSRAEGINDSNVVTGWGMGPDGKEAFVWDQTGGMTGLGFLPGYSQSLAYGVNNSGQIAGFSDDPGSGAREAVLWDPVSGMTALGPMMHAWAINDAGQVTGNGYYTSQTAFEALLWDPVNGITGLGPLPGETGGTYGKALNNVGEVAGTGYAPSQGGFEAFTWNATEGMTGLGDLKGGDLDSQVLGINDAGLKVGWGTTRNGKEAVIWNPDGLTALKELVDASADGWLLLNASGINESGQIVGTAINPAGQNEAFLLTPQYQ